MTSMLLENSKKNNVKISKLVPEKLPTTHGKVQSRNYGPNSFPIAYKNKFKIAKSAVLSKFWVAACQLKYFNTSLIFDLISIPISLLDLNNSAATQSDRGQV